MCAGERFAPQVFSFTFSENEPPALTRTNREAFMDTWPGLVKNFLEFARDEQMTTDLADFRTFQKLPPKSTWHGFPRSVCATLGVATLETARGTIENSHHKHSSSTWFTPVEARLYRTSSGMSKFHRVGHVAASTKWMHSHRFPVHRWIFLLCRDVNNLSAELTPLVQDRFWRTDPGSTDHTALGARSSTDGDNGGCRA